MVASVAVEHRTTYRFERPAVLGPHLVRLRPAPHSRTPIESYSLSVSPAGHFLNWQQDPFGNHVARLVFPDPVTELDITVNLVADLTVVNPLDFFVEDYATQYPFRYPAQLASDLAPYLIAVDQEPGPEGVGHQRDGGRYEHVAEDAAERHPERDEHPVRGGSSRQVSDGWKY